MINRIRKLKTKNGFTLVEIMIVVAIVALLATLAIPNYTRHMKRARASEAVATMTMIRQSLRDYFIVTNGYYDVTSGNRLDATGIDKTPPTGAGVDVDIAQYFSNKAFSVTSTLTSGMFSSPSAQGFIIKVNGANSDSCGTDDCALNDTAVADFQLEMDNTGRTYVSFDSGGNWTAY